MQVSCLQYTAEPDIEQTWARIEPLLMMAALAGPDLVVLPECALFLSADQALSREHAVTLAHPRVDALRQWAADQATWVVVGSVIFRDGSDIRNRMLVFDRQGALVQHYDKIHMFDVTLSSGECYRESALFTAGSTPAIVDIEGWRVGLSICFDLRFPKLYRHYAKADCDLILAPSAFTQTTGEVHWQLLNQARAVENGCFVVAANQCGVNQQGRATFGHSQITGPWGEILAQGGGSTTLVSATIDQSAVATARAKIPVLSQDRDFDAPALG